MTDIQKQHQTEAESLQETLDSYASHIRTATDGGDAIVDCLIRIMEDDSVGAKPHERLDAQLLLDSIGFGRLAAQEATRPRPSPETNVAPGPPSAARVPLNRRHPTSATAHGRPLRREPRPPSAPRLAQDRQRTDHVRIPHLGRQRGV